MKVLMDSNVVIDAFTARENKNEASIALVRAVLRGQIKGYLCTKQITDIHYVLRKYLSIEDREKLIGVLINGFSLLPLEENEIRDAYRMKGDFEDNVLISVARKNQIGLIATNDKGGFVDVDMAVTPVEALKKLAL